MAWRAARQRLQVLFGVLKGAFGLAQTANDG
jgi:hypothetical protein